MTRTALIGFYYFISPFPPQFQFRLRRYIKHSGECLLHFQTPQVRQNYSAECHSFNSLLSIWKCGQAQYSCFIQYIGPFFKLLKDNQFWVVKTYKKTNFLFLFLLHLKTYSIYNMSLHKERKPGEANKAYVKNYLLQ